MAGVGLALGGGATEGIGVSETAVRFDLRGSHCQLPVRVHDRGLFADPLDVSCGRDVTVLANPKLLVINKQRGEVMIGNRDGYLTTTVTETVATQTVQFLETGTRLVVRPFVGRDGVIRLEIHPEDSAGAVTQIGDFILPRETTTEVTSNVLVRDGHTIVIGGLMEDRKTQGVRKVPILGDIPVLQYLFSNAQREEVQRSILVVLTPRRADFGEDSAKTVSDDPRVAEARERLRRDLTLPSGALSVMRLLASNRFVAHYRSGDLRADSWRAQGALDRLIDDLSGLLYF